MYKKGARAVGDGGADFLHFLWASLRTRENFPPFLFPRYNKTPLVKVQQHLENSFSSVPTSSCVKWDYWIIPFTHLLDETTGSYHSLICLLTPQILMSTTSGLCYTLGCQEKKKIGLVSEALKSTDYEGRPMSSTTTTRTYFNCEKYYQESMQDAMEAFNKETWPEGRGENLPNWKKHIWKGPEVGKCRLSLKTRDEYVVGTNRVTGQPEQDGATELARSKILGVSQATRRI